MEPVMSDERLGTINPCYMHRDCACSYFYTMHIIEKSYQYCAEDEEEIRKHIADNENA